MPEAEPNEYCVDCVNCIKNGIGYITFYYCELSRHQVVDRVTGHTSEELTMCRHVRLDGRCRFERGSAKTKKIGFFKLIADKLGGLYA